MQFHLDQIQHVSTTVDVQHCGWMHPRGIATSSGQHLGVQDLLFSRVMRCISVLVFVSIFFRKSLFYNKLYTNVILALHLGFCF